MSELALMFAVLNVLLRLAVQCVCRGGSVMRSWAVRITARTWHDGDQCMAIRHPQAAALRPQDHTLELLHQMRCACGAQGCCTSCQGAGFCCCCGHGRRQSLARLPLRRTQPHYHARDLCICQVISTDILWPCTRSLMLQPHVCACGTQPHWCAPLLSNSGLSQHHTRAQLCAGNARTLSWPAKLQAKTRQR